MAIRDDLDAGQVSPPDSLLNRPGFGGYVAWADVVLPAGLTRLVSVHSPTGALKGDPSPETMLRARRSGGTWNSDVIFTVLREQLAGTNDWIVGGDWNESPFLWDQANRSQLGRKFFARARQAEWIDCARLFHPTTELPTWIGRGQPFQDDHVFVARALEGLVLGCEVDATAARRQLSDHAPLLVWLA